MTKVQAEGVLPVVSLPMRDGNRKYRRWNTSPVYVVSLPMRDGNLNWFLCEFVPFRVVSLPMRDGNEIVAP